MHGNGSTISCRRCGTHNYVTRIYCIKCRSKL